MADEFDQSIVIDKCQHFYFGLDGNHATCVRYSPVEYPNCSKCDVYEKLSISQEVPNIA